MAGSSPPWPPGLVTQRENSAVHGQRSVTYTKGSFVPRVKCGKPRWLFTTSGAAAYLDISGFVL